jgi:pimeloyl-ACP methyl ester carboxylesterase
MGAGGFVTLAGHFSDRTVVTYDPRGVERSEKDDASVPSSPVQHAADLRRLIEAIGLGPLDVFGSSGGAINVLALVTQHPNLVRTAVVHEPPLVSLLPDRQGAEALVRAIHETYQRSGFNAGMAHFIVAVSHSGEVTDDVASQPAPDPSMFGMPTDDDGTRNDPMLSETLMNMTFYQPDFDALRKTSTRLVIAAGEESNGEMAQRGAFAVAEKLGRDVAVFPSNHGGFLGGEYGQMGNPDPFAAALRKVLETA